MNPPFRPPLRSLTVAGPTALAIVLLGLWALLTFLGPDALVVGLLSLALLAAILKTIFGPSLPGPDRTL